jgi:predicted HicB family RNase H-like nuclease
MASTRVQMNLKLPPQLRDRIVDAARAEGVSINRFCEFGLSTYLQFLLQSTPPPSGERDPINPRP